MAIVESTTIDGRSRLGVCENSPPKALTADAGEPNPLNEVPSVSAEGISPACGPDVARTFLQRRMTVGYIGPRTPYLRMQGQWLDGAGFGVGTRVRVDVSERRLVIEPIAGGQPRYAEARQVQEVSDECLESDGSVKRVRARKSHCVRSWPGATWYSRIEHDVAGALRAVLPLERRRERVSVRALAERTRFDWQLLRGLEEGCRLPSIPVFIVLAWALNLDPRELFDRVLKRMNYPEGSRPVLVNRAPPDIPSEDSQGLSDERQEAG